MSPGQRRYIERRLAWLDERMGWMQHHLKLSSPPEWMVEEFPTIKARADILRARLA